MKRAGQLLYDYKLIIRKVENYARGEEAPLGRIIEAMVITIIWLLMLARLLTMAFVDNHVIQILMNDCIERVGDRKSSMMFSFLSAWIVFTGVTVISFFIYYDWKKRFKYFKHIFNLIENKPAIDLSFSRHRRLTLGLHLMTEYFFPFFYGISLASTFLFYTFLWFFYLPDGGSVLSISMALF